MDTTTKPKRIEILSQLGRDNAIRVFTFRGMLEKLQDSNISVTKTYLRKVLVEAEALGVVSRAAHGVYMNKLATPKPTPEEVAPFIRSGAIVSLQRVLGKAGVLNNPSNDITCILPASKSNGVGEVRTDCAVFRFYGMSDALIPSPEEAWHNRAFQPYSRAILASPEKAFMDWLYLSEHSKNWDAPQAGDIDFDELDVPRMKMLAKQMNLSETLSPYIGGAPPDQKKRTGRRNSLKPGL